VFITLTWLATVENCLLRPQTLRVVIKAGTEQEWNGARALSKIVLEDFTLFPVIK